MRSSLAPEVRRTSNDGNRDESEKNYGNVIALIGSVNSLEIISTGSYQDAKRLDLRPIIASPVMALELQVTWLGRQEIPEQLQNRGYPGRTVENPSATHFIITHAEERTPTDCDPLSTPRNETLEGRKRADGRGLATFPLLLAF